MVLSKKNKSKLSSNYKILLRELDDLTVAEERGSLPSKLTSSTEKQSLSIYARPLRLHTLCVEPSKQGLTPSRTKKVGRPRGPSLINTARLLTG